MRRVLDKEMEYPRSDSARTVLHKIYLDCCHRIGYPSDHRYTYRPCTSLSLNDESDSVFILSEATDAQIHESSSLRTFFAYPSRRGKKRTFYVLQDTLRVFAGF